MHWISIICFSNCSIIQLLCAVSYSLNVTLINGLSWSNPNFLSFHSFYGAQQLSLDFGYIKVWLAAESNKLSPEIQSHLLNLDVFRHLDGAVRLLMLQPRKKKQTPDDYDDELESNVSTMSSSSVLSSLSGVDIDGYDIDVLNDKTIPNRQKWLDLRLRGGKSKKGLLPFCLKVQEMKWCSRDIYCD